MSQLPEGTIVEVDFSTQGSYAEYAGRRGVVTKYLGYAYATKVRLDGDDSVLLYLYPEEMKVIQKDG